MSSPRFTFIVTEDGSPTVRMGPPEDLSEAMHSLKGAFSETVYIYGTAIEAALRNHTGHAPLRVLSMGLGLGYVEILSAALCLKHASPETREHFGGESFEIVLDLRERFRAWVLTDHALPDGFREIYDEILARCAQYTRVPAERIKAFLQELILSDRWVLRDELSSHSHFHGRFECICFDAFSSKTSPDLWTEAFLESFFAQACAPQCVLSTYACTGALKRSLKACGFDLFIREGFSSKRDSTFAVRKTVSHSENVVLVKSLRLVPPISLA